MLDMNHPDICRNLEMRLGYIYARGHDDQEDKTTDNCTKFENSGCSALHVSCGALRARGKNRKWRQKEALTSYLCSYGSIPSAMRR